MKIPDQLKLANILRWENALDTAGFTELLEHFLMDVMQKSPVSDAGSDGISSCQQYTFMFS